MGRRELVIILGFLAVGALLYQFTAPPAVEGQGFSFSRILEGIRRETNPASAEYKAVGTLAAPTALKTLRLESIRKVSVVGESRDDIDYELTVRSDGPDEATALQYAKNTQLRSDDLGESLSLDVQYPEEASQVASLVLRVPSRLHLRISGRSEADVTHVAGVHLDDASGATSLKDLAGAVTGFHRSGPLTLANVDRVDLSLRGSRATVTGLGLGGRISTSGGELTVAETKGPLEISQQNTELVVRGNTGAIQVNGSGGEVRIDTPGAEVRVDVRRTHVSVALGANSVVPVTILTSSETIRVVLGESDGVTVDAAASNSEILSEEFGLTATKTGGTARLVHTFGASASMARPAAAKVLLRNERGDIVLSKRK